MRSRSHAKRNAAVVLAVVLIILILVWALLVPMSLQLVPAGSTGAPGGSSTTPNGSIGTVLSSSGSLNSGYFVFAPVASTTPGVDGYSTDSAGYAISASLVLTTVSSPDLVYVAVSVASSSASSVLSVRDSSGLNWTRRATFYSAGVDLQTWYAWSGSTLTGDNITATLASAAYLRVAAVAIHGALQDPFPAPPAVASGSGTSPSVPISSAPGTAAVYLAILGSGGSANVSAGAGFSLNGESAGPPSVALESAATFTVTHPPYDPYGSTLSYLRPNATFTLTNEESWVMIGDVVAVATNASGSASPSGSSSPSGEATSLGLPMVATCAFAQGGSLVTMLMNDTQLAGWVNGYNVVPVARSTDSCSTFQVPQTGDYYLVVYNNQSVTVNYTLRSYLTYSSESSGLIQELSAQLASARSSSSSPGNVEVKGIIEANGTWSFRLSRPDGTFVCAESGNAFLFLAPSGTGESGYLNLTVTAEQLGDASPSPSQCGFPFVGHSTEYIQSVTPTNSNPAGINVLSPVGFTFHIPLTARMSAPEPPTQVSLNFTQIACMTTATGVEGCPSVTGSTSQPWGSGVAYDYYITCNVCSGTPPPVIIIASFQGTLSSDSMQLNGATRSFPYAGDPNCNNDPQCPGVVDPYLGTPQLTLQLTPYPCYLQQDCSPPTG